MIQADKIICEYCGKDVSLEDSWPHVDGDSNLGVRKIDYFCSESHKIAFFSS
ncbi:MAG: hypothetical protein ACTHKC_01105 [Candidatus Nitrosocosmicus sp.]